MTKLIKIYGIIKVYH